LRGKEHNMLKRFPVCAILSTESAFPATWSFTARISTATGIRLLLTLVALLCPRLAFAQSEISTIGPFAYVTNHNSGSVSVIDTSSNTVATTIFDLCNCDSPGPAGLAVSPGGKFVYVANEFVGTVAVIDTSSNSVSTTISLPCPVDCTAEPVGVAITPNGAFVYVTDAGHPAVYVIQTSTNTAITTISSGIGTNPFGVAVDPTGSFVYVTNGTPGTEKSISVISTSSNTVIASISVGTNPTSVAFQPGAKVAYVTNGGDGTVSIINTTTNTVTNTVSAGSSPYFVAFTPNGAFAYITNQLAEGASVTVINTASPTSTPTTISVGSVPVQIAITPDGSTAYVAIGSGEVVTPIPTATNTPGPDITVGSSPFGIAIGPEMEGASLTGNAQTITFPFFSGGASISFTFPQGWCANAPCTVATAATDTPDAVWQTESGNYPGTHIAPVSALPGGGAVGGDGVVYTVTCKDSTGAVCSPPSGSDNYNTTLFWDTQINICGMGPALGKQETAPTWENILGTCNFTADPSTTTSGNSKDGLSRWASFYNVTGTPSATVTITTPPNGAIYMQNQSVLASYSCGGTFVECAGTVANGSAIDTSSVGLHTFTAEADVTSGPTAKSTVSYFVGSRTYGVQLLYPSDGAVKSPATFPIKMYLTLNGIDVSSSTLVANATAVLFINGSASGDPVVFAGSSNADFNFRFDSTLGPSGGYIFNFKTSNLASGNYLLEFTVSNDPTGLYVVPFAVK
jgi:YVTN family beta-propeller protein